MTALMLRSAVASDPGPMRAENEDSAFASPRLAAVADGVGGAAAGEVASAAVIDQLILMDKCRLEASLEAALERAVSSGNASVGFIADCRPAMAGMSTTLTAVALGEGRYVIANLGDSRAYLLRDGELTQLTRDDSYVQHLLEIGAIDSAEARRHPQRSVVLAALDGDPARAPAIGRRPARVGDRLLLCSDGLSDFVDEDAIASALTIRSRPGCARRLVELALAAGGSDNVSVVVADVVERDTEASGWLLKGGGT